jgi:hypothetical protein
MIPIPVLIPAAMATFAAAGCTGASLHTTTVLRRRREHLQLLHWEGKLHAAVDGDPIEWRDTLTQPERAPAPISLVDPRRPLVDQPARRPLRARLVRSAGRHRARRETAAPTTDQGTVTR